MKFLRTFLVLVEERSTAKAGRRLGMHKSNVLAQVARIEDVIGAQLFHRQFPPSKEEHGRTQLTEAGRAFLPKAVAAIQAYDRLFDDTPVESDPREINRAIATTLIEKALAALRHDLSDADLKRLYDNLLESV